MYEQTVIFDLGSLNPNNTKEYTLIFDELEKVYGIVTYHDEISGDTNWCFIDDFSITDNIVTIKLRNMNTSYEAEGNAMVVAVGK